MLEKLQVVIFQQLHHNGRTFVSNYSHSNRYFNTFSNATRRTAPSVYINERSVKQDAKTLSFSINNKYTRDFNNSRMDFTCFQRHNHFSISSKMSLSTSSMILARSNIAQHRLGGVRHFSGWPNIGETQYNSLFADVSNSSPVDFVQNLLLSIHSAVDLPWWAVIMLSTISIKIFISLPLALFQEHNKAKLRIAHNEINEKRKTLSPEATYVMTTQGLSKQRVQMIYNRKLREEWRQIVIKHNCHPAKNFLLAIIQLPLWVLLSISIRNLCCMLPAPTINAYVTYNELKNDGFGWIQDLTQVDPLFLLPICSGITTLMCIEMQLLLNKRQDTLMKFFILNIARLVVVAFTVVGTTIPSAITIYWATSSTCSLLLNVLLLSPKFRRLTGILKVDSELQHPYLHLQKELKRKLNMVTRLTSLQNGFNVKGK